MKTTLLFILLASLALPAFAEPVPVHIERTENGGARLLRDGKPYAVKGAGGQNHLDLLVKSGGNSIRTWGIDADTGKLLDAAHAQGLSVCVGIWIGQIRQGFNYQNADQVEKQIAEVRAAVEKYRDHPAVLMWGIGNEMEAPSDGENPALWMHIDFLARMVKDLDPEHPTITVVAELGGKKVAAIHQYAPSIDLVGINAYGGAVSVAERYHQAGGTKPFLITEFGPAGFWEIGRTEFGAAPEASSTEKAAVYRKSYEAFTKDPLCLGSYAFLWGTKEEGTSTWFGMLLPDGSRLAATDTMQELWTGQAPKNRVPKIEKLTLKGPSRVKPGATLEASLTAIDPEKDALKVEWLLTEDPLNYGGGGDFQAKPQPLPDALVKSDATSATFTAPAGGGTYRIYAYVRDSQGGAAVANVPFLIDAPKLTRPAAKATLPFTIYAEGEPGPFAPSGYMGQTTAIRMDERSAVKPFKGKTCLQVEYQKPDGWGGVVWQNPPNDWGDQPGGYDLAGAKTLSFAARGQAGGEVVKFGLGIIPADKPYADSLKVETEVTLTAEWKVYTVDLAGRDASRVKSGFVWTASGQGKPIAFYLDEIRVE